MKQQGESYVLEGLLILNGLTGVIPGRVWRECNAAGQNL